MGTAIWRGNDVDVWFNTLGITVIILQCDLDADSFVRFFIAPGFINVKYLMEWLFGAVNMLHERTNTIFEIIVAMKVLDIVIEFKVDLRH